MNYVGSKMARFRAMAAAGILTTGIMMGAMTNDAHAQSYVDVSNSTIIGDVTIGGVSYGDRYKQTMQNNNMHIQMEDEYSHMAPDNLGFNNTNIEPIKPIDPDLVKKQYQKPNRFGTIIKDYKEPTRHGGPNRSDTTYKATQRSDGTMVVGLEKNKQKRQSKQHTQSQQEVEPDFEESLKNLEEALQEPIPQNDNRTGNSFRDMLNVRNTDSPYYVQNYEQKEKEAKEKKETKKLEDRSFEEVLGDLL